MEKISIITACYNSEKFIEDTIKSVLEQDYPNIEYLIIDGNSKDKTLEIIKKYEPEFKGRMKWISEKDKGIYDAMNKGIRMATGDIVGLINSDDFLANKNIISKLVEKFNERNYEAVYGDLDFISEDDKTKIVRKWKSKEYVDGMFKRGWHPAHPTLYIKKSVYNQVGEFSLDYKIAADFDLMLRVFEKYGVKSGYLPTIMVKMRIGGASTSGMESKKIIAKECSMAWKKNGLKKPILFDIFRLTRKINQLF